MWPVACERPSYDAAFRCSLESGRFHVQDASKLAAMFLHSLPKVEDLSASIHLAWIMLLVVVVVVVEVSIAPLAISMLRALHPALDESPVRREELVAGAADKRTLQLEVASVDVLR